MFHFKYNIPFLSKNIDLKCPLIVKLEFSNNKNNKSRVQLTVTESLRKGLVGSISPGRKSVRKGNIEKIKEV